MNTSTQQQAVAVQQEVRTPVLAGSRGLVISDMEGLWRFSGYVASSGLAPKGVATREAIFVAVQMGLELGLTPMAALQNIAVVNGRPTLWGDAQLAVARSTGELEVFEEWYEENGKRLPRNPVKYTDDTVAVCKIKRRGYNAAEQGFSVSDAKSAGLWGKQGPWSQFPARMLKMRARSFALRDQFGDALRGFRSADDPVEEITTTVAPAAASFLEAPAPAALPPAQPEPTPEPTLAKTKALAVDEVNQIEVLATGLGATFEDFLNFARENFEGADTWSTWSEVPADVAKACLRARGRFVGTIQGIIAIRKGGAR